MKRLKLGGTVLLKKLHLDRFIKFFPLFVFALLLSRPEFTTIEDGFIIGLLFVSFSAFFHDLPLWIILEYVIDVFKGSLPKRLVIGFITVNLYYTLVYNLEWYLDLLYYQARSRIVFLGYLLPVFAISFSLVWFFARFSNGHPIGD